MRVTLNVLRGPQLCFSYLILGILVENNQCQFFSLKKNQIVHENKVKNFLKLLKDNAGVILPCYYQQIP